MPILNRSARVIARGTEPGAVRSRWLSAVIQGCLMVAVAAVPLLFVPATTDPFDFPKVLAFAALVLLAALAWATQVVVEKRLVFRRTPFDIPVLAVALAFIASTIFSQNKWLSVVGDGGYYHHTLLAILSLIVFFFLITNHVRDGRAVRRVLIVAGGAAGIAIAASAFQALGMFILPWALTETASFTPLFNSPTLAALWAAALLPAAALVLILSERRWWRVAAGVLVLLCAALLLIVDKQPAWYTLIAGSLVLLALVTVRSQEVASGWVVLPTLTLAIAILFIFIPTPFDREPVLRDVVLDQRTSWQVAGSTLADRPILGTGPGGFVYAFTEHRPDSFNDSSFWSLRFVKSGSEATQLLTTLGVVGVLPLIGLAVLFIVQWLRAFARTRSRLEWMTIGALFIPWIALAAATFYYPGSFVLLVTGIATFALAASLMAGESKSVPMGGSVGTGFALSLGYALVVIFAIVFGYWGTRLFVSDVVFARASGAFNRGDDIAGIREQFNRAYSLNSRDVDRPVSLAQVDAVQAVLTVQEAGSVTVEAEAYLTDVFSRGQEATERDPGNPATWEAVAGVYQSVTAYVSGAEERVKDAWQHAKDLEPKNPRHWVSYGQYLASLGNSILTNLPEDATEKAAQEARAATLFEEATAEFTAALERKADYTDAEAARALVAELAGDRPGAIEQMETLVGKNAFNADLIYELGRLYIAEGRTDDGKAAMNRVVSISPEHANAHYQLGLLYEAEGNTDVALAEFEQVLSTNPDNETVKAKIEELKQ